LNVASASRVQDAQSVGALEFPCLRIVHHELVNDMNRRPAPIRNFVVNLQAIVDNGHLKGESDRRCVRALRATQPHEQSERVDGDDV